MGPITTGTVAAMHGVRRQTVVRWIDTGLLPAWRGSGKWWLIERRVAAAFQPPVRRSRKPKFEGCEVPGCTLPHRAKKKCKPHYARWLRTGSVNAERPIARVWFSPRGGGSTKPVVRQFDLDDTGEL
jgi:excisionase family DNA binding protein